MLRRIYLLIFLVLIPFLGSHGYLFTIRSNEISLLFSFLALSFLILNEVQWRSQGSPPVSVTALAVVLLLFYTWSALGYFYTVRLDLTFGMVIRYLGAVFLGMGLLVYFRERDDETDILWTLLVCSGAMSFFGIHQQFVIPGILSSHSVFYAKNYFATYLLVHLPLCCYLFQIARRPWQKVLSGLCFVLILNALIFTGSRAGQLIGGSQLLVIAGYLVWRKMQAELKSLGVGCLVSMCVYLSLIYFFLPDQEMYQKNVAVMLGRRGPTLFTLVDRWGYWMTAFTVFKENWIAGTGPLTFPMLSTQYGEHLLPTHAHSLYIETLTDAGLIGFVLLMGVIFLFYSKCVRLVLEGDPTVRIKVFLIAVSVSGFLIHNLIEFSWDYTVFLYLFTILVLLVDHFYSKQFPSDKKHANFHKRVFIMVVGGYALVGLMAQSKLYFYDFNIQAGWNRSANVEQALAHWDKAKTWCSRCDLPGMLSGELYMKISQTDKNQDYLEKARNEFKKSLEVSPMYLLSWLRLGEIALRQNNFQEAGEAFQQAARDRFFEKPAQRGIDAANALMKLNTGTRN